MAVDRARTGPRHTRCCLNDDDAPLSALDRRERNDDGSRASPRNATRSLARRQPRQRGGAWFQGRGSPLACAAPQQCMPHSPTLTSRQVGAVLAAMSRRPGTLGPPPTTSRTTAPPASCHPPPRTGTRSGTSPACRIRRCSSGLDAADYWFGYSDDSSARSYDQANDANAGAGDEEAPHRPETGLLQGAGPSAAPTSPAGGADINALPKPASSRQNSRRSTTRCGCFAPLSPESLHAWRTSAWRTRA
jgi:hypothetical protein